MSVARQSIVVFVALLSGSVCFAANPALNRPVSDNDQQQLIGVWEFVSLRIGQREQNVNSDNAIVLDIRKDKIVRKAGTQTMAVRYKLDPSKNPKQLDWVTQRDGNDVVSRRIYEVKDHVLRMCFLRSGERPTGFEPSNSAAIVTFRRRTADGPLAADRARQVNLQLSPGAAIFKRTEVASALGLTAEQKSKIDAITRAAAAKYNQLIAKSRDETDVESRRKLVEQANQIRSSAKQKVVADVLNDGQTKRWKELLGKPATATEKHAHQQRQQGASSRQSRTPARPPQIPALKSVRRVAVGDTPTRQESAMALWIRETKEHPVTGNGYVVLTDHTDDAYLSPLRNLCRHHSAQLIQTEDLGQLHNDRNGFRTASEKLKQASPRFVAVAPKLEHLSENTLMCMWELLSGLDDDPQIDVFPGILVAATSEGFARLIQNSIGAKPHTGPTRAFGICQAASREGFRSYQKIEILKNDLVGRGGSMASAVVGPLRDLKVLRSTSSDQENRWHVTMSNGFVRDLPRNAVNAIEDAPLLVLFGHGVPGMVCGIDIIAFDDVDLTGKTVLSGCCFAGASNRTDIPRPARGPDGSVIESDRPKFVLTAVNRGAVVAYGHMRLSNGFPSVVPLLEGLLAGKPSGEIYQQLLNSVMENHQFEAVCAKRDSTDTAIPANQVNPFLHLLVSDPALVPYQANRADN